MTVPSVQQLRRAGVGAAMGLIALSADWAGAQSEPKVGVDSAAPYTRYHYPIECAPVQGRRARLFWRNQRPDTVYHPPMGDTPFRFAVNSTRECVSRYPEASVVQRDLIGYGSALLAAEEWGKAEGSFQRLLGLLANASTYEKARALTLTVGLHAGTTGKIPAAMTYQQQLDALGDVAAPEQLLGYLAIARRGQFADSLDLIDFAVTGALKASRAMVGDTAKHYVSVSAEAYLVLADLQARRHEISKAVATIELARATLVPIRRSVMRSLGGAEMQYQLVGKPAPQLKASTWYGGEGDATQRPTKGKPTLVVFAYHNCGDQCYAGYSVLRRLYAKYAASGLQVVFASRTMGYYRDDLVRPDAEATFIQQYFVDSVKVPPVSIAIWKTPLTKRPRDGRMMIGSAPNEQSYQPNLSIPLPTYLVDRDGIVQLVSSLSPGNEALLDHQIGQFSKAPAAP